MNKQTAFCMIFVVIIISILLFEGLFYMLTVPSTIINIIAAISSIWFIRFIYLLITKIIKKIEK